MLGDATAYDALIALIYTTPAVLAAIFAGIVLLRTKTTNGQSIGQMVEDTHTASGENNTMLRGSTAIPDEAKP